MRRSVLAAVAAVLMGTAMGAGAGEQVSEAGKFSVWIPDRWTVQVKDGRVEAHTANDSVQAVAGRLKDPDADLGDDEVVDFIDEEMDDLKVTRDETRAVQGRDTRFLEGTGRDEGDAVIFKATAFDPGGGVLVVLVYGDQRVLEREDTSRAVERILRSLRAQ